MVYKAKNADVEEENRMQMWGMESCHPTCSCAPSLNATDPQSGHSH